VVSPGAAGIVPVRARRFQGLGRARRNRLSRLRFS
jgi:hypothetical protein